MAINTTPITADGKACQGLEVSWEGGQFVMIVADKGLVSCGIIDKDVMDKFGFAIAIARGTPEKPLVKADDLLTANIADVTDSAAAIGVKAGMTGREALEVIVKEK